MSNQPRARKQARKVDSVSKKAPSPVNTARETLVDEDALYEALVSGRLAGAALDVVRPREGGGAHPLSALDHVILTPHIGGATRETLMRGAQMIAEEIRRFAGGEPLVHVANREALR